MLTYSTSSVPVQAGPLLAIDGPGTATIRLNNFQYYFTNFVIDLGAFFKLDVIGLDEKKFSFDITDFDLGNQTEDLSVGPHSGNPHYAPAPGADGTIREGAFVLIDLWAKLDKPDSVFYDITWTGVVGKPTEKQREIFDIVRGGRDAGIKIVQDAFAAKRRIGGWEVDKATRDYITSKGYGKYFAHRTGHSIGVEIHSTGANMDNLETKDDREIIPNTCFSIEPGVYLPGEFGVRSEVNVLTRNGSAEVTGKIQRELVLI